MAAAAAPRRRRMIGRRRRVEDDAEDEGGPDALDLDEDSLSEGSISDDHGDGVGSDTSNIDETSPTAPVIAKPSNGAPKASLPPQTSNAAPGAAKKPLTDTELMLQGMSIADQPDAPAQTLDFDDVASSRARSPSAPIVVSSASAARPASGNPGDRRRQEHEDYKRRRDEDPAFVPNRGSFFMHDHRHAGPAANGFRPFGRGRGRGGRGGGGIGGPFAPIKFANPHANLVSLHPANLDSQFHQPSDPTTNSPWTHDMHEAVAEPPPNRRTRHVAEVEGPPNGDGFIPTREPNAEPINRTLSTEKHIGNAAVRVFLPDMKAPAVFPGVPVKLYTKLPDHRPPLRRDKAVRISLPNNPPRYIYPASDRSFVFIPRAMRPNQQRWRGKPRSGFGSMGGFSRRTSVFGSYYGSMYSPSVAMSRRSSFAQDRDFMFSPTGSVVSRPPMDSMRPVVRLPPSAQGPHPGMMDGSAMLDPSRAFQEQSIVDVPQPSTYPLPQKPDFHESQAVGLPMHQPRPQKNISVAHIESPTMAQGPTPGFHQAFHQQVPIEVASNFHDSHVRQHSYVSQQSTGTPLSQIPERAIHAAPFQPHTFGQQPPSYYNQQQYPAQGQQQGYYYGQGYAGSGMPQAGAAPSYSAPSQPHMPGNFAAQGQADPAGMQGNAASGSNLVAQEVNGMVYYYDASQLPQAPQAPQVPQVNSFSSYQQAPQGYQPSVMGMGGMVTPSPDGAYYYGQPPNSGMVYYPQ